MGSRWGMNRSVGQILALLLLSAEPRNADQIVAALGMSRSNVSLGLKELQAWNLIRLQHLPGDRKDYYTTPDDVWTLFQTLTEQRRRREIDPTVQLLRSALREPGGPDEDDYARERMRDMLEMVELMTGWLADVQRLERATLVRLLRLGGGIGRLVELSGGRRATDTEPASASLTSKPRDSLS